MMPAPARLHVALRQERELVFRRIARPITRREQIRIRMKGWFRK